MMTKRRSLVFICCVGCLLATATTGRCEDNEPDKVQHVAAQVQHVATKDLSLVKDAFLCGYTRNLVNENVAGRKLASLTVGCIWDGKLSKNLRMDRPFFSVWTRDLYWGYQGWAQAGDDSVLATMKSSLELLILAKDKNQALGHVKHWPLNDERFYVPQAYTTGVKIAEDFFPWCSESQAHFILLARDYWRLSGDLDFIRSIWPDICYVAKTLELMDTNGNALPDNVWGSYDYQGIGVGTEEPLLCATTYAAYRAVAELARELQKPSLAQRLDKLADRIHETMNKPITQGGLWKLIDGGGYFVNVRVITPGKERIDERFIPYENLGPMFFGITSPSQDKAIFAKLDADYDKYYGTKYGPMYIALAVKHDKSEVAYTSAPWLGFLDVYLRCKRGVESNRSRIFKALIDHAYDIPTGCFTEGLGVYGYLSGVSGRSWDNGNFFHTLMVGIYGVEKSARGIRISPPVPVESMPISELKNVRWRDAVYDLRWEGSGRRLKEVRVDGQNRLGAESEPVSEFVVADRSGKHQIVIVLED